MHGCFSTSLDTYASGSWHPSTSRRPPYRIEASLWDSLGTNIRRSTPQHYGRCDDVEPNRTHYEWSPDGCTLSRFDDVESACNLLANKSILFVGDSTVFQLFLSFALLLRSKLGRNAKRTSSVTEMSASACDDTMRLAFARSDLLLWSSAGSEFNSVRRCDGATTLQSFAFRAARDADIVILGTGHHFQGSLNEAIWASRAIRLANGGVKPAAPPTHASLACLSAPACLASHLAHHAFIPHNLNHTLASLVAARAAWGHRSAASSVLVVGTTTPVAGCSRFSEPIRQSE